MKSFFLLLVICVGVCFLFPKDEEMSYEKVADIVEEMDSDDAVDFLEELDEDERLARRRAYLEKEFGSVE